MAARKRSTDDPTDRTSARPRADAERKAEAAAPLDDDPLNFGAADGESDYFGEDSATLGDRIAAARQNVGLTQAGLASRLGVGAKIVSAWENDRSEPRANRLAMLSGLLGVSVAWLLTGRGEGVEPPSAPDPATNATFHLSVAVSDLEAARRFYADLLGCPLGRAAEREQSFGFFGGWLTAYLHEEAVSGPIAALRPEGLAEGRARPTPSLGVILEWDVWTQLIERLRAGSAVFEIEPMIRHVGAPEEEGAFFIADPSGNALEFRAHRDQSRVMG